MAKLPYYYWKLLFKDLNYVLIIVCFHTLILATLICLFCNDRLYLIFQIILLKFNDSLQTLISYFY